MIFSRSSSFAARFSLEGSPDEGVAGLSWLEDDLSEVFLDEDDSVSSFFEDEDLTSSFLDEEDFASIFFDDDDDLAVSFFEDEESASSLEDELSWDSEDSSVEGSAEVEELSSPHAANRNAEEIKKGRIFL